MSLFERPRFQILISNTQEIVSLISEEDLRVFSTILDPNFKAMTLFKHTTESDWTPLSSVITPSVFLHISQPKQGLNLKKATPNKTGKIQSKK